MHKKVSEIKNKIVNLSQQILSLKILNNRQVLCRDPDENKIIPQGNQNY